MEQTINVSLVMRKALIERRNQLKELVEGSSKSKMYGFGDEKVREEPTFSVQDADGKKVQIDMALFELDAVVKQANAVAMVKLPEGFDFKALMAPIVTKEAK